MHARARPFGEGGLRPIAQQSQNRWHCQFPARRSHTAHGHSFPNVAAHAALSLPGVSLSPQSSERPLAWHAPNQLKFLNFLHVLLTVSCCTHTSAPNVCSCRSLGTLGCAFDVSDQGIPTCSVREDSSFIRREAGWTEAESADLGAGPWVRILALLLPGCRTSGLLTHLPPSVIICPVELITELGTFDTVRKVK